MKAIKKVLIIILILIALPLVVALFIPNKYTVSVSTIIDRPREVVYDYVRMMKNQKEYSVWVMQDPDLQPQLLGEDGTVGAIQKWNSKMNDVGEGEQEITMLTPDRMDMDLRFKRPFEGEAKAANIFEVISETQTKVTSEFYNNTPYPFNLPAYLFGRKMLEEAQTKNLSNLKAVLEKK